MVIMPAGSLGAWYGTRFALGRGEGYIRVLTILALALLGLYYLAT